MLFILRKNRNKKGGFVCLCIYFIVQLLDVCWHVYFELLLLLQVSYLTHVHTSAVSDVSLRLVS
jgi:hypothetical protein